MLSFISWTLNNSVFLLLGIIGIGFLIGIHELGHFLMCKIFNIHTPTFSIGFGPTILSTTMGNTHFTLNAIPLGGYVEIAGLAEPGQGTQEEAHRTDAYSFKTKPYYQKLLVALGGIICNILFSILIFTAILTLGTPKTPLLYPYNATNTISTSKGETQLSQALQENDTVLSINDSSITTGFDFYQHFKHTQKSPTDTSVSITIQRDGEQQVITTTHEDLKQTYVQFTIQELEPKPLVSALTTGINLCWHVTQQVFTALKQLVVKQETKHIGGPLMIIAASAQGAQGGILIFLLFLAFLSINLAALNILPIPVLDGGHIVFLTIEALYGKPIPEKVRTYIDYTFALLLIGFILLATFFDVRTLFNV